MAAGAKHSDLFCLTPEGLYCPAGRFHIDPWRPVETAVLTHGHGDHARPGSRRYHAAARGLPILRHRLGAQAALVGHAYREPFTLGEARVTLFPAGHVLGSAQVLIEHGGHRLVISGDYKRDEDPSCDAFEVVECDTFITEATFALPVYAWKPGHESAREILAWWDANARQGRTSVLYGYALGKTQRILAELALLCERPVYVHGAIEPLTQVYRDAGIRMLPTLRLSQTDRKHSLSRELVLAPPSAHRTSWIRRFDEFETAFASGWMRVRGNRRRKGYDRGFVVSDHADWNSLLRTIAQTRATRILVTHGNSDALVRHLREQGRDAEALATAYGDDELGGPAA